MVAEPVLAQRPGGFGRGARGHRGGRRGPREFTPEQRAEMYDRMAERYLEFYSSDYELTEDQQVQVRSRLDELKAKQKEYADPLIEEFGQLRREMYEMWQQRRDGEEVDEERMNQIRERFRAIHAGSPLMNPDNARASVEELLPEDQVAKGRERRDQRRADWEARREEWRRHRRERGERGGDGRGFDFRFGGRGDPWDRYVDRFVERYQLDDGQTAMAESVLRELKERRDAYRTQKEAEYEALRDVEDRRERWSAYEKLNEPIDQLFDQLETRLRRIPTTSQIEAAEANDPEPTRSAGNVVTSRPAGATSRPADRDRGSRGRGPRD